MNKIKLTFIAVSTFALTSSAAFALDDASREALMKSNGCPKCHAVAKDKVGPSFQKTAAKYKGNPDAVQKLFTHLTTGPKIKVDGEEQDHKIIKTASDDETKEVIAWILAQ